jgi:thymidine kinase
MLSFRPQRHGRVVLVVGPVLSGKKIRLQRLLNSARIIWNPGDYRGNNIVLAKHPADDHENPGKVVGFDALETEDPDKIAERVGDETEAVVIAGLSHFQDERIVTLVRELAMSNRLVLGTGHNLDWEGKPINHISQLMSLADEIEHTTAPCMVYGCDRVATRSQQLNGGYERRCIPHHFFKGRPDVKFVQPGGLELFVGNMFSVKTTSLEGRMIELAAMEEDFELFRHLNDVRHDPPGVVYKPYDRGFITLNNKTKELPCVVVPGVEDISRFIEGETGIAALDERNRHRKTRNIFIDEGHFFPGLTAVVAKGIYQGYRYFITGILRDYQMDPAKEIATLLPLADKVNILHAYCDTCGREASESQMYLVDDKGGVTEAPYDHFKENALGGDGKTQRKTGFQFAAMCKDDIIIPGYPLSRYNFSRYEPPRTVDEFKDRRAQLKQRNQG